MSDEKDALIAKAMGHEIEILRYTAWTDSTQTATHIAECPNIRLADGELEEVPRYDTPEGVFKIIDYMRDNPKGEFVLEFVSQLYDLLKIDHGLDNYWDCLEQVFTRLTPSLIKQAAYEAAKECVE